MFKVIEKGQIIDVLENLKFVKCLPRTKKIICVDERQANGIMASNGNDIQNLSDSYFIYVNEYRRKFERDNFHCEA